MINRKILENDVYDYIVHYPEHGGHNEESETYVHLCRDCNERLGLNAHDKSVCPDLICSVRGCSYEADFYLEIDVPNTEVKK